jgi:2-hydroxychromene-2-carboxylate isomerase
MSAPIEFWLSIGSPSAYLASQRVDGIAARHGRSVLWRPFNIRAVLEQEGIKPNVMYALKGQYQRHDWDRTARLRGIPYRLPDPFGRSSIPAMTIFYGIQERHGHDSARKFADLAMKAYFVQNRAIDQREVLVEVAKDAALAGEVVGESLEDSRAEEKLSEATREAASRGIWGAPFVVVDGELFWGEDRLDQVDLWLERGGW